MITQRTYLYFPLITALSMIGLDAHAADNGNVQTLETITVSASRSQTAAEDMPTHTTIITQEEIRKSPAQTLDQILRTIPGLNFTGVPAAISDPTGQQTRMRGLGNAKVLVLLDGIPVIDPFYLTTQWYKIPVSNIERVEVMRGGASSLWGSMAVGGVVNIITKRPKDGAGEFTASVGMQHSSTLALSKNFVASEALSFNFSIDEFKTHGYQTTPDQYLWRFPEKQPNSAKDTNFQLTTYFKPSADLNGFLRLGQHIQDQNIGYQYGSNEQYNPDISAGLTKELDKSSDVTARYWAQYVNFEKYNGNTCYEQASGTSCVTSSTVTPAQVTNNVVQYYTQYGSQRYHEQGSSVTFSKTMDRMWNSVQVGVDYRHLSAIDTEYFYSTPTSPSNPQTLSASTYGQGEQTFKGIFAQTKLTPVQPLEVTLSARYDSWVNDNRINTLTKASTTAGGPVADSKKSALNPSIGLLYLLNDQVSLRGAAYRAFRAPGFNNTTRSYGANGTTVANPDLAPETMTGWELGGDYRTGALSFGATYFLNNISDMIAAYKINSAAGAPQQVLNLCSSSTVTPNLSNCGGSASYYTNNQNGRSRGIELTGNWKTSTTLTWDASYTHTNTYLTSKAAAISTPLNVQLVAVPKDVASLGATWKPFDKLRTYAQLYYIGPMYIDETSTPGVNYRQGGSSIVNSSATYAVDKNMDVFLGLVNLFNKTYQESAYTVTQPWTQTLSMPRSVNVGLKARF
jgi:iron complex outermembrane receptor protein